MKVGACRSKGGASEALFWPAGPPFEDLLARLLGYILIKSRHFLKNSSVFTRTPPHSSSLHFCFVTVAGSKLLTCAIFKRSILPAKFVPLMVFTPESVPD